MARFSRRRKALVAILVVVFAVAAGATLTTAGQTGACTLANLTLSLTGVTADAGPTCAAVRWYHDGAARLPTDPRAALRLFGDAAAARPRWVAAHVARGHAAEMLGDFGTALAAYQRAGELSSRAQHHRYVMYLAGRMGRLDLVLPAAKASGPSIVERLRATLGAAIAGAVGCAVDTGTRRGHALVVCPRPVWAAAGRTWRATLEGPSEYAFSLLIEDGRRDEALALARTRGWTAPGVDHCAPGRDTIVAFETAGLLAMLVHPERADCALGVGVALADAGLARLARIVVADRAQHGAPAAAARAAWVLRYRLPKHDVAKVAESLNVTGYRLQHSGLPELAVEVYERARAADPRFSWPANNIALVHLAREEYGAALQWTSRALAANPDHWRARRSHAMALHGTGRHAEAIDAYQRALRIEPNDTDVLSGLGRVLIAAGREAEGTRVLNAALQRNPSRAEDRAHVEYRAGRDARHVPTPAGRLATVRRGVDPGRALDRARAAYHARRYPEALGEARAATDAEPNSLAAALLRAQLAALMGELPEAREWHARAAALAPDDVARLHAAATFAVQVGEYEVALRELDRLVALQPSHVQLVLTWGPRVLQPWIMATTPGLEQILQMRIDILMEQGDLEAARRLAVRHALVIADGGYCDRARRVGPATDADERWQNFRLATLAEPQEAECTLWYGQWLSDEGYLRLGRVLVMDASRHATHPSHRELAERFVAVRIGPEVPKAVEQLFQIARQRYLRDDDATGAATLFDEVIRRAPAFARPYVYRARMAADDGDTAAARAWLERAIVADPRSWRAHRNLGMLLARAEQWADTERALRQSLVLFEHDPGARFALARALYAQGRHADAVAEMRAGARFAGTRNDQGKEAAAQIRAFLAKFDQWGPGAVLPPAPDPHVVIGFRHD